MAVPASGELKLWDTLWNQELGGAQGENSLHSASIYAGFSTPDALSDFYGWSDVELPTVTTYSAAGTTSSSVCTRVCVNATGNEDPTYGVYFGTNSSAHTNNTKYVGGTGGVGLYCVNRTGLNYQTTYYWWGFACNSAGEVVGNRCAATTPAPPFSPSFVNSSYLVGNNQSSGFVSSQNVQSRYQNPYTSAWTTKCNANEQTSGNMGRYWSGAQISTNSCNCLYAASGFSGLPWDGNRATNRKSTVQACCAGGGIDSVNHAGSSPGLSQAQSVEASYFACEGYGNSKSAIVTFCH